MPLSWNLDVAEAYVRRIFKAKKYFSAGIGVKIVSRAVPTTGTQRKEIKFHNNRRKRQSLTSFTNRIGQKPNETP